MYVRTGPNVAHLRISKVIARVNDCSAPLGLHEVVNSVRHFAESTWRVSSLSSPRSIVRLSDAERFDGETCDLGGITAPFSDLHEKTYIVCVSIRCLWRTLPARRRPGCTCRPRGVAKRTNRIAVGLPRPPRRSLDLSACMAPRRLLSRRRDPTIRGPVQRRS